MIMRRTRTAIAARTARRRTTAPSSASNIENILLRTISPADEVAAIVVEPMQGEGGYIVPPQKFFDELRALAEQHGILLVFDEMQPAWAVPGRCGLRSFRGRARYPRLRQRHRQRHAVERDCRARAN